MIFQKVYKFISSVSLFTVASLRAEYATALDEKKKTYAGYREARADMRDLLLARENVGRLLNISGPERERDTERADL